MTKGLFFEPAGTYPLDLRTYEHGKEPFSLNVERPGIVCVRKTFVDLGDPTGYRWAMKYLGDWDHWLKLCESPWFSEALNGWIKELEIKIRSEAIVRLVEISGSGTPQAISAAKFLATLEYKKQPNGRGRPSKSEMSAELKHLTQLAEEEQEDYERIRLVK